MTYIPLKQNDVRQEGDEQRASEVRGSGFYDLDPLTKRTKGDWRPTALLGHPILSSDLCHLEFRRPIK